MTMQYKRPDGGEVPWDEASDELRSKWKDEYEDLVKFKDALRDFFGGSSENYDICFIKTYTSFQSEESWDTNGQTMDIPCIRHNDWSLDGDNDDMFILPKTQYFGRSCGRVILTKYSEGFTGSKIINNDYIIS